jgi:hypothetical protein
MLIDQYAPEDVFAHVLELDGQTDPVLWQLDRLLEDEELYHMVRRDLGRRYPQTLCRGWSYRETERRVADSLVLRWFCRVYFRRVPDATTLWSTWLATRASRAGGSCALTQPSSKQRSITRPTAVYWSIACGC